MRKFSALILLLAVLLSVCAPALALSPYVQHQYSTEANSGVRHEACLTLNGTTVNAYYTGEYSFNLLQQQSGDELLQSLRTLMSTTHHTFTTYDQCRDLAVKTDCENGDGTTINLLYSSYVSNRGEFIDDTKKGWNREHVWPRSLGGFYDTGAGADLHHIRPTDSSLNGTRGNSKYGYAEGGREIYGTVVTGNALGGKKGGGYMEPLDNVKGDVARICLYVYVRYGGELSKCSSITTVFQSIDVLLQWHAMDPVDTWEMGRNEVVCAIQGNRNVFIDYPELAWLIFDREVPADLVFPSQGTLNDCEHKNLTTVNAKEANCVEEGYTGDVICADCHMGMEKGTVIAVNQAHVFTDWTAIEGLETMQERSCDKCGFREARTTPVQQPQPDENTGNDSNDQTKLLMAVSGVVIIVAAAMVVVLSLRRRKKQ